MNKLRVGVILPDHEVPAWVIHMMETIKDSPHAEVTALAFADQRSGDNNKEANKLYDIHFKLDRRLYHPSPNPWEKSDIRKVLHNTQLIGESLHERISRLKAMRLDVLLNLSLDELPKSLLDVARFGVWSLRCNDMRVIANTEVGWLEVLKSLPIMFCDVEIQRQETLQVVTGSVIATHIGSITLNQKSFFWRAASVILYALKHLYTKGEQEYFSKARDVQPAEKISTPTFAQFITLARKQFMVMFENKIWRRWFPHQWAIMVGKGSAEEIIDWGSVRFASMPPGVFWADPFILKKQDKSYLFFEEYLYTTKLGHISYALLNEDGSFGEPHLVLERPYHLSYPFIFEHRGEFYMIPETAQNKAIEVYRCTRFPDQWEFYKTLIQDVQAVDTTLFEYSMRWWMFVNIAGKGGSTWDELHLFYSDDPLSTNWTAHPMNPVISDVRSARPAGRLFRRDGRLMRPSQDSSLRYGYALNINQIKKLTIHEYEEELIERIEPPNERVLGVHTYNTSGNLIVVDALFKK